MKLIFYASTIILPAVQTSADSLSQIQHNPLVKLAPRMAPEVAKMALRAAHCAVRINKASKLSNLGIIDYSMPSTSKRFWLFDLSEHKLLIEDFVAHGRNTGDNLALSFSNTPGSLESSLGLFQVGERYIGKHGTSLRLIGLEPGINHLAFDRAIVIHGASYVNSDFIKTYNRLGRSFGCPALAPESAQQVIQSFEKNGGFLFAYYPDQEWLQASNFLNSCNPT